MSSTNGSTTNGRTIKIKMRSPINGLTISPNSQEEVFKSSTFSVQLSLSNKRRNIDQSAFNQAYDQFPLIFTTDEDDQEVEVGRLHLILDNCPHFYIHVEPKNYNREYGFDYMKSEYIKAKERVRGIKRAISTTITELEEVYAPIRFFENQPTYDQYYSPWISLLSPEQGQTGGNNYILRLKKTVLFGDFPRNLQIEFRCTNANIQINNQAINDARNPLRLAYRDNLEFNIRCVGEIADANLAVNLYAIVESINIPPFHVGRIFVQPNNIRRNVDVLIYNVIFTDHCQNNLSQKYEVEGSNSLTNILNQKSFNQSLVSCNVTFIPQNIDLRSPFGISPIDEVDKYKLKNSVENRNSEGDGIGTLKPVATNNLHSSNWIEFRLMILNRIAATTTYQNRENDINAGRAKVIALINIAAQSCPNTPQARFREGFTTGEAGLNSGFTVLFCERLNKPQFSTTLIHELGHMLGLRHSFERIPTFEEAYTDSFMDYDNVMFEEILYEPNIIKERFFKSDWDAILNNRVQ